MDHRQILIVIAFSYRFSYRFIASYRSRMSTLHA